MATIEQKLAAVEIKLKRWQTKLKRATNEVTKLDKQRRRYQLQLLSKDHPVVATVKVKMPTARAKELELDIPPGPPMEEIVANVKAGLDDGIPDELRRTEPLTADQKAEAKAANEELSRILNPAAEINRRRLERNDARRRGIRKPPEKAAMPLTGKAARDYIKKRS